MAPSTEQTTNASQNPTNEENQKKFKDMRKFVGEQEARLQELQNVGFQLANYYFVFQGVILTAISNASSLTCSDRWFLFALSLLATIVNLCALFAIGKWYIDKSVQYDKSWSDYNDLTRRLSPIPTRTSDVENQTWEDQYAKAKRYFFLSMCLVLFLGFASIICIGCWKIDCRHDD